MVLVDNQIRALIVLLLLVQLILDLVVVEPLTHQLVLVLEDQESSLLDISTNN